MDWGNLILALAGILFGSGIIGQLIMFFVKRYDEKNEKDREFYRIVYNKLRDYCSALEHMLLTCLKESHNYATHTGNVHSRLDDNISKIEQLQKSIKSRERKCKKNGKPDKVVCEQCNSERKLMGELFDECQKLQQEAENKIELMANYWSNNYEQTYTALASYVNIENLLYSKKGCDKKIVSCIRAIDKSTLHMCRCLSFKPSPELDFEESIIKQMSLIDVTLQLISKQL